MTRYYPSVFNMFSDLFDDYNDTRLSGTNRTMATDIRQEDGQTIIECELPGYTKDEIKVNINNGYLIIVANHNDDHEVESKKGTVIRNERNLSRKTRSFYVGDDINADMIKGHYENGILTIMIPQSKEESHGQSIAIE